MTANNTNTAPISQEAGLKSIDALIAQVPKKYKEAHTLVQEAAVAIVEHAKDYGDCTRALTLVRAVPIQQARSLITYFMTVSPIGVLLTEKATNDKVRLIKKESKAYNPFDMDKARAISWWTLDAAKAEKEAIQAGAADLLKAVMVMLDKAIQNEGKGKVYTQAAVDMATDLKANVLDFQKAFAAKANAEANAEANAAARMAAAANA